ncbi:hypothetical protein CR983_01685 [Candidatus Saccharibacteria bacterium]|nr:MAG: hypothetical protein CR983_01685 [Candidatus Saccharibacteria bacterium]
MKLSNETLLEYVVVIPAYNEEARIESSLRALKRATDAAPHKLIQVLIALNGCSDDTKGMIHRSNKKLQLPITIIECKQGYLNAMNTLFDHVRRNYPHASMLKTDADSLICKDAISILLDQMARAPELVIVGGHPLPILDTPTSPKDVVRNVKARMLALRSLYPLSQVSRHDVRAYHSICHKDPQDDIGAAEERLKTFFHGRLWCARTVSHIANIDERVLGDDVYLTVWVYKTYGPNTIRVRYDANTMYHPYSSLQRHWKVYKRIHEDRQRVMNLGAYRTLQQLQQVTLDWKYILSCVPVGDAALFGIYWLITRFENISFGMVGYRESFWQYQEKEA